MRPVVKRIADELRQSLRPFLEFLPVGGIPGDILFFHTVCPHLTPLIVVAAKPYLGDILKFPVFKYLLRIYVAVIIQHRYLLHIGKLRIEFLRCITVQQEILSHEFFQSVTPFLNIARSR